MNKTKICQIDLDFTESRNAKSANKRLSVADLHSKILDAPPPGGSKFSQFHAVFGKIWRNRMLARPPPESWRPLLGEILDPPLFIDLCSADLCHPYLDSTLVTFFSIRSKRNFKTEVLISLNLKQIV